MENKLNQLKSLLGEIHDLQRAAALLEWDQQVNMPSEGAEARGNQLATLQRMAHVKSITPEMGQLLEDLQREAQGLDPDSDEARLIKVAKHDYDIVVKVPPDFTSEFYKVTALAYNAWQQARAESDFSKFQPHLELIVDLGRQYVEFFAPYEHAYDPMLDRFEPGMKSAEVKAIFDALRPQQVELLQAIADRPQVDDSFLYLEYDE